MSVVLFDATRRVKPARPFGRGVLASRPTYRAPYTAADLAWLAADDARREDEHFDRMAREAGQMARLEAGLCL